MVSRLAFFTFFIIMILTSVINYKLEKSSRRMKMVIIDMVFNYALRDESASLVKPVLPLWKQPSEIRDAIKSLERD